jgi:hypothetical protein
MPKPETEQSWVAVLEAIQWARKCWPEVEKAQVDLYCYGEGYLRVTPHGIEHIPAERIRIDAPPPPQP